MVPARNAREIGLQPLVNISRKGLIAEIGPSLFRKQAFQKLHLGAKTVCSICPGQSLEAHFSNALEHRLGHGFRDPPL